jgi:hypothetical protein
MYVVLEGGGGEEVVMAYLKVLPQQMYVGTEENWCTRQGLTWVPNEYKDCWTNLLSACNRMYHLHYVNCKL